MTKISLKISNVAENGVELYFRLKKIKTKSIITKAMSDNNWFEVYKELLYRIEFYAENGVLNYTKQDLFKITQPILTKKVTIEQVAKACVKTYSDEAFKLSSKQTEYLLNLNKQLKTLAVEPADTTDEVFKSFGPRIVSFYEENEQDFKSYKISFYQFAEICKSLYQQANDSNYDLFAMMNDSDYNEDGLSSFLHMNPTDTVLEVLKSKNPDEREEACYDFVYDLFDDFFGYPDEDDDEDEDDDDN